ncbi:MAG TPA: pyridoxamine 5'-phosphate oxidase family protein [Chitinophagaceae bacterium]|nr:pyridoxamine 5'-phosphate oxidase family protein [Chitinophagaceae bacterium]
MIDQLKSQEIEELLKSQVVGRIACHADDLTYIVPISYSYDGEHIYAHATDGMKIRMMRKNPKVCFQTDKMENMANWQSVVAWGEFEELTNSEGRKQALKKLIERVLPVISSETVHLSPHWPFPPEEINSIKGIVFRIKLQKKTGRFEKSISGAYFAS